MPRIRDFELGDSGNRHGERGKRGTGSTSL